MIQDSIPGGCASGPKEEWQSTAVLVSNVSGKGAQHAEVLEPRLRPQLFGILKGKVTGHEKDYMASLLVSKTLSMSGHRQVVLARLLDFRLLVYVIYAVSNLVECVSMSSIDIMSGRTSVVANCWLRSPPR
eukprot:6491288-Amphidinium_carterae.6